MYDLNSHGHCHSCARINNEPTAFDERVARKEELKKTVQEIRLRKHPQLAKIIEKSRNEFMARDLFEDDWDDDGADKIDFKSLENARDYLIEIYEEIIEWPGELLFLNIGPCRDGSVDVCARWTKNGEKEGLLVNFGKDKDGRLYRSMYDSRTKKKEFTYL